MIYTCILGKPSEDKSHPDYVPNQKLPGFEHRKKDEKSIERYNRASKRKRNDFDDSSVDQQMPDVETEDVARILVDMRQNPPLQHLSVKGIINTFPLKNC